MASFCVVLSNDATSTYTYNATTGTFSFATDLRSMVPAASLQSAYNVRFALTSETNTNIAGNSIYNLTLAIGSGTFAAQSAGARTQNAFLLYPANKSDTAVPLYGWDVRATDNWPVKLETLGEVYDIDVTFLRNLAAMTALPSFILVIYFDEVVV